MGSRKSAAEKLTQTQIDEIIKYFSFHTFCSTMRAFNLTRSALTILFNKYNIQQHSSSEAETLKHIELDGYDKLMNTISPEIYSKYEDVKSVELVCQFFNIKEYFVIYLLQKKNIDIIHTKINKPKIYHPPVSTWYDNLSKEIKESIIDYYLQPNTIKATAEKFGFTVHKIHIILDKSNIALHNLDIKNKLGQKVVRKNLEEKYGVVNVFQLNACKDKAKQTKKARYGDEAYTNRAKASETCLKKYGATSFLGSDQGKEAIKKYSQENYGTDYMFQSVAWQNDKVFRSKAAKTREANKYSEDNFSQLYLDIYNDKEKLSEFIAGKTLFQIADELDIKRDHAYYLLWKNNLLDKANLKCHFSSHYEDEIINFIGPELCIKSDRTVLSGWEIDIYIPSKKLGIEFNGTYWHSALYKDKNYHLNKSKLAEEAGIRLIHIYEHEWTDPVMQDKLKLMLDVALGRVDTRIYARKCQIKQITNQEAKELNDKVHLQGHRNAQITYGLFYNNQLVQLMSFSKTKYNRNLKDDNSWEIIRGCPGSNNIVIGGVSKLLAHFIKEQKPSQIFSYCDFNKFDGKSYEAAGMKFIGYTGPDMSWVMPDYSVIARKPKHHKELKELAVTQIFGAGSKKYLLKL